MPLTIEQYFPQGRFHATRWRENPFADGYGEWPPSPWRLVRAVAARWFQYSRETDDRDETLVSQLLRLLASRRPQYYLPPSARKCPALKQYQPISEHSWSDPSAGSGAVKRAKTTLFPDAFFAIDPAQPVIWRWPELELGERERELLGHLLARITYFGRAESLSRLQFSDLNVEPNCYPVSSGGDARVLCFTENQELDFGGLLGKPDSAPLEGAPIPPGTEWILYQRPERRPTQMSVTRPVPPSVEYVQFALGGHVLPKIPSWIKVTERFRGRVLKHFDGPAILRSLLSGKTCDGQVLGAHQHAFFLLWPDEDAESPSKLIVWRRGKPFHEEEIDAMMLAALKPIPWTNEEGGWAVHVVPLPLGTAPPKQFQAVARTWESVTPFIRPHNRHFRRSNGKTRAAETPEQICSRLIENVWGMRPLEVSEIRPEARWVNLHETLAMRRARRSGERTPHAAPGHYLRVTFAEPFQGPLIVGDSSHFGLGVFRGTD